MPLTNNRRGLLVLKTRTCAQAACSLVRSKSADCKAIGVNTLSPVEAERLSAYRVWYLQDPCQKSVWTAALNLAGVRGRGGVIRPNWRVACQIRRSLCMGGVGVGLSAMCRLDGGEVGGVQLPEQDQQECTQWQGHQHSADSEQTAEEQQAEQ